MAAVKSKVDEIYSKKDENTTCGGKSKPFLFTILEICFSVILLCIFVANFCSDIIVMISYFKHGKILWAITTFMFMVVPATVVQLLSMRWYIVDDNVHWCHWLTHVFLLGILHRYVEVLKSGWESLSTLDSTETQRLHHLWNDVCLLHLFESFMESAPQFLLQVHILIGLEDRWSWIGAWACAATSLGSLAGALAAQALAPAASARARTGAAAAVSASASASAPAVQMPLLGAALALALRAAARVALLAARLAALLLLAAAAAHWTFLLIGIHWIAMTTWIILQKTEFCSTVLEERVYNCVIGVMYCFCFFSLNEETSSKKALIFYCITIAQNLGCLGLFITLTGYTRPLLAQAGAGVLLGCTILGLFSMVLYHRYFYPVGPILFKRNPVSKSVSDIQTTVVSNRGDLSGYRSLEGHGSVDQRTTPQRLKNAVQEESPNVDDSCADKKLLLNHWASFPSNTTPSENIKAEGNVQNLKENVHVNLEATNVSHSSADIMKHKRRGICSSEALEMELENSKNMSITETKDSTSESVDKQKRKGIYSLDPDMELDLEIPMNTTDSDVSYVTENNDEIRKQKRRGILSSSDLCLELEEEAKRIINSENNHVIVDVDRVHNGKQNTFNERSFECDLLKRNSSLSEALKSTDLRLVANEEAISEVLSAPSEVLSAHDYENICAVNIAREAWGLRSWRGYSDIETWLHDDSVVRDRRRDTLTSTVTTITSASSEQSATSGERSTTPPPLPSRRPRMTRSRQDDYLDTLADDLAACDRPLPEFTPDPEVDSSFYIARPYLIDQHGTLFPLTTLDTIMEEIEETSTDTSDSVRYWHKHGSASTLVATIDGIRSCNLYNSSELLWDGCTNPSLNVFDVKNETLSDSNLEQHLTYEDSYTGGSCSHLSPEEILFLSKLKQSDTKSIVLNEKHFSHKNEISDLNTGLSSNNEHPEHQFGDTRPLAVKNNALIKTSITKSPEKCSTQEKIEMNKFDNLRNKEDRVLMISSTENIDCETNCHPFSGSTEALVPVNNTANTPAVINRIHQWNNFLRNQNTFKNRLESSTSCRNTELNQSISKSNLSSLKERRTMFLKQVLSPPRFHSWSKKGASSLNSVQLRAS